MAADIRAMVLAAGLGTRLRPLTERLPKPLLPLLSVPLVDLTLERLRAAGVGRVVFNLHHLADVLRPELTRRAAARGLDLTLIHEPLILGTGGGLANAAAHFAGADVVLLVNGDSYADVDLAELVGSHLDAGAAATLLVRANPDPIAYQPVEADASGRVWRIAGRPTAPVDSAADVTIGWLFAGIHALRPDVLGRLSAGVSDINRTLHPSLITAGELVRVVNFTTGWWDLGTPRRLLDANREALADPPRLVRELLVQSGGLLTAARAVAAGARVHPNARLAGAVVGVDCHVGDGAEVVDSLLLAGARVEAGARVDSAIVGPGVVVGAGKRVHGLMLVDDRAVAVDPESGS